MDFPSPRRAPDELDYTGTPEGTPRIPRVGTPSTPPVPNIPPRGAGMSYGSPSGLGLGIPASRTSQAAFRPRTPQTGGGLGTPGSVGNDPQRNLDDVTDEELARVLRRHLVTRNSRPNRDSPLATPEPGRAGETDEVAGGSGSGDPSLHSAHSRPNLREESEPFPIPYDAPGADIT